MRTAAKRGADVVHFPEGALSGYAGTDFASFDGFDWDGLGRATGSVLDLAAELGVWVVLGSAHRLSGGHKPHNSVYVVASTGEIVDRYDKRFCSGDADEDSGDLSHYTPGDHLCVWEINAIRCGALICYDYRYPELYRDYKRQGVELIFHSFHAANAVLRADLCHRRGHWAGTPAAQPGGDIHVPGHHDACDDDRRRRIESRMD